MACGGAGDCHESGEETDDSLNFRSDKFDPLKVLYSKNVQVPNPKAPIYDNLAIYASKQKPRERKQAVGKTGAVPTGPKLTEEQVAAKNKSRFLPHQLPVKVDVFHKNKDILDKIPKWTGPLAALKNCLNQKIRIKVITRNDHGIRGHCIGFVHAFDKQWNMALSDVIEVWTRKQKNKIISGLDDLSIDDRQVVKILGKSVRIPRIRVTKLKDGMEKCERHIPQMLMRGEHVVLVVLLENS
ncbi:U6 snRNA-associated Sm-like protein LSm11 [Arctopsyche grandis]|uniref:U6 snRNA-associated Sm-like protein LSm11 n=1 Tax=Arctopsyche grandis TaxID=121162 RepID=UPI00406D6FBD